MSDGTMGGKPLGKPAGSMLPPNFVEDKRREKDLASLEQATNKQNQVEEAREESKEQERQRKIDELLPETIATAYGVISYAQFKQLYADVYEGVAQKEHWATGFITHDTNLPGGTPIKVRNFRRGEGDAIRALMPRTSVMEGGSMDDFYADNSRFVMVRIMVALMEFDGKEQTPLPTLSIDSSDKWLDNVAVKRGKAWLDNLPDQLVTFMDAVINDVLTAYNAAATENLKNQLAPLLDSTE